MNVTFRSLRFFRFVFVSIALIYRCVLANVIGNLKINCYLASSNAITRLSLERLANCLISRHPQTESMLPSNSQTREFSLLYAIIYHFS